MKYILTIILLISTLTLSAQFKEPVAFENLTLSQGDTIWFKASYHIQNTLNPEKSIQSIQFGLVEFNYHDGFNSNEYVHVYLNLTNKNNIATGTIDTFLVVPGHWPKKPALGKWQYYKLELMYNGLNPKIYDEDYFVIKKELNVVPYEHCSPMLNKDTIEYYVCSEEFKNIAPQVFLESQELLLTKQRGCDSIVDHYIKYIYDSLELSDTVTAWQTHTQVDTISDKIYMYFDSLITIDVVDTVPLLVEMEIYYEKGLYMDLRGLPLVNNKTETDRVVLHLYPVPANEILHFEVNNIQVLKENYRLNIYNLQGKCVYTNVLSNSGFSIPTKEIGTADSYVLQISNAHGEVLNSAKFQIK